MMSVKKSVPSHAEQEAALAQIARVYTESTPSTVVDKRPEQVIMDVISVEALDVECEKKVKLVESVRSAFSEMQHITEWFNLPALTTVLITPQTMIIHSYVVYCEDALLSPTHHVVPDNSSARMTCMKIVIANPISRARRIRISWY